MLRHPTVDHLHALGLLGMAQALEDQGRDPAALALPFEDRLALLIDREVSHRETKRTMARLRHARLRVDAQFEDIDWESLTSSPRLKNGLLCQIEYWSMHPKAISCTSHSVTCSSPSRLRTQGSPLPALDGNAPRSFDWRWSTM
jgi:hypothetical protein